jgi:serine/threonine protein kinase
VAEGRPGVRAVPVGPGLMLASRYRLVRLLGRGGMGEVYEAIDGVLSRRVAVKVFRGETDLATSRARQQLEIQAFARLQHPNIVAIFDAGTDAGISFVVMQLIDGVTLAERTRASAIPSAETARIGGAIADALAHVHALGMVHRDIKPGNILCGANGTVFLTDFGIVRLIGHTRLTHGTIGTVSYLAPEQVRGGDIGTAADIYALALVLLECLTGAPEYPGASAESALARLTRPPRVPPTVPHGWFDLLTGMTTADPAARPTAGEVARILHEPPATSPPARTLVADEAATRVRTKPITIEPPMPTASSAPVRHRQRRAAAWLTAAGVFAAVMIIAALVWILPRDGSSPSSGQQAPTMSPDSIGCVRICRTCKARCSLDESQAVGHAGHLGPNDLPAARLRA